MAESTALADNRDLMTEHQDGEAAVPAEPAAAAAGEPLVAEELLVEEVSIDGMCGVY